MKKLLSLALILMVCCSASLLFSGCDSSSGKMTFGQETAYSITVSSADVSDENYDDTRYAKMESITFQIKKGEEIVVDTISLKEARDKGASIKGFDIRTSTATGETRKATVTYKGVTGTFEYTVVVS